MNSSPTYAFQFDWTHPVAFIWGLGVLVSLVGWGRMLNRWLDPSREQEDFGLGMAATLGLAAFLVLSGPMLMLSVFSKAFIVVFLLMGWFFSGRYAYFHRSKGAWTVPPALSLKVTFVALCLLVLLTYAGAEAARIYNDGDDFTAYFGFSKMALDMGTLADPFNYRLLGSMGGQPILVTLVVAFLPWKYANLLDMGIAGLIVLALAQELVRGNDIRAWRARLLLVALALTFAMPRNNTASEYTGVVFFMAAFRWLEWISVRRYCGWKLALIFGALAAAASTLRCHDLFFVIAIYSGFVVWRLWEQQGDWRGITREALVTLSAALVAIIPWFVVTYRSSGAFLYPIFKGTQRPDSEQFNFNLSHIEILRYTTDYFFNYGYLLFFLPICLLQPGRERRALLLMAAAILVFSGLLVSQLAGSEYFHVSRYLDPILFAFALSTFGVVLRQVIKAASINPGRIQTRRSKLVVLLAGVVLFCQAPQFLLQSTKNLAWIVWASDAQHGMIAHHAGGFLPADIDEQCREYPQAFAQIPPGSKTLIALDFPFLLNYQAQTIYSLDFPGVASPDQGLPYFHGSEPVKQYLLSHGIRYIAHVPFDHSDFFHGRKCSEIMRTCELPVFNFYGKLGLNFSDNVDELAKSNRVLYDSPTIRVIDLGGP